MAKGIIQFGLAISVSLTVLSLCAYAENPEIAMGETGLIRAGLKMEVGKPVEKLPPLEAGRNLEIDGQVRTLGGDWNTSSASPQPLPTQKFPFFLDPAQIKTCPELTIGYVRGLNTPEAHAAGQSNTGFVSSPAVIKVNGVRVQYIYTAGELVKVKIPREALRPYGFNVLQIEAGFYFLPGNRLAYDQIELQHLALSY